MQFCATSQSDTEWRKVICTFMIDCDAKGDNDEKKYPSQSDVDYASNPAISVRIYNIRSNGFH